jgi:hypothetical protein
MTVSCKDLVYLLFLTLCISGCWGEPVDRWDETPAQGYIPVYASSEAKQITFGPPRLVRNPGKIFSYGNLLFVNEKNEGIHVFDNEDAVQPIALGFLNILGNSEVAVRDSVLYADHAGNIVAIAINDLNAPAVRGTLPLQNWDLGVPPPRNSKFECVDPSRGVVVNWKYAEGKVFDCYAY